MAQISGQPEAISMFYVSLENPNLLGGFTVTAARSVKFGKLNFTPLNYFVTNSLGFTRSLKHKPRFNCPGFSVIVVETDL